MIVVGLDNELRTQRIGKCDRFMLTRVLGDQPIKPSSLLYHTPVYYIKCIQYCSDRNTNK